MSNTHLSWNPEYDDVKLWQTAMLMKELEKFIMTRNVPLVLCGDFNSDTNSAVYKLLASNRGGDRARYVGLNREELPRDPFNILHGKISHNVILDSAYRTFGGKDPDFTNYTGACRVPCEAHACAAVGCDTTALTPRGTLCLRPPAVQPTSWVASTTHGSPRSACSSSRCWRSPAATP